MSYWFQETTPFTHLIAVLLLLARLGDIVSTRLATPTLMLEGNPIVRRLGWRYAWLTVAAALIPYLSIQMGIAILAASLMVSASNFARVWMLRTLGEETWGRIMVEAAAKSRLRTAIGFHLTSVAFVVAVGIIVMWLSGSMATANFWFGVGIALYGAVIALHGSRFFVRLFQRALEKQGDPAP